MATFAVIMATIGRETMEATLDSIVSQSLEPGDQLIVVRDSYMDHDDRHDVRRRVGTYAERYSNLIHYHEHDAGFHWYGVPQFNFGLPHVKADFVLSIGDDDVYCDGTWSVLRQAIGEDLDRVVLFRFVAPWREILWDKPQMVRSRISGQCIAAPRDAVGFMGDGQYVEVDFEWMEAVIKKSGRDPQWLNQVLSIARPEIRDGKVATLGIATCQYCDRQVFREDLIGNCCIHCSERLDVKDGQPRILFVWPAAEISVSDVARGYRNALEQAGCHVFDFKMHNRFKYHAAALAAGSVDRSHDLDLLAREATDGIAAFALRHAPIDVALIVSGMAFHPDGLVLLDRLGIKTAAIFTESPYDDVAQTRFARYHSSLVCGTNDAGSAARYGWIYLPPAYDPAIHKPVRPIEDARCDVVVVGTGWRERIELLEQVDWTGIALRLYGHWLVTDASPLRPYIFPSNVHNEHIAHVYASAKICLNIHRAGAEGRSVNPRCIEVAACGGFLLTDHRAGLEETFKGMQVPVFSDSDDLGIQIRRWLKDDEGRRLVAQNMRLAVQKETFDARVTTLFEHLNLAAMTRS